MLEGVKTHDLRKHLCSQGNAPAFEDSADECPALADSDMAAELHRIERGTDLVLVIANAYTVCLLICKHGDTEWLRHCSGEFGEKSLKAAKPLMKKRLTWADTEGDPVSVDPATVEAVTTTVGGIRNWLKQSDKVTKGRQGHATSEIKRLLPYLAGWRCQFEGCGCDLGMHEATGQTGNYSYFAHIVASSADGPRGDPVESPQLASEPENFMLLCDKCHRLIDKIAPKAFDAETLRRMRARNIAEVRRLLNTLQHRTTEVVAILGNIAGQPAQLGQRDVDEALWSAELRSSKDVEYFFNPGAQHHDVHSPAYWSSLFQQLTRDLPRLQDMLEGTRAGSTRPRMAIFPQHSTSVMLLAGRVLGDTAGVHIFQPHRNQPADVPRWAWPEDAPIPPADKYRLEVLREAEGQPEEANLIVGLTFNVSASRMPPECATGGEFKLPTLLIVPPEPNRHCIQHPDDLSLFGQTVDEAMRQLLDVWRVRRVHLFVCSPASAVVVTGQKMQARQHPEYVVYESLPGGPDAPFTPTIAITASWVREVSGYYEYSLQR